jgi:hypothetical protein
MTTPPNWLPLKLILEGTEEQRIAYVYIIFERDFKGPFLWFRGQRVKIPPKLEPGKPYEKVFWHIISKQCHPKSKKRKYNDHRASRLPWCRPIIVHSTDPQVCVWDYREGGGQLRSYIWLKEWNYMVILEQKNPLTLFVTAFYVEGPSWRRTFEKKYKNRIE